ncbi:MAG: hypothetical protein WCJ74_02845, partial [bacterium]
MTFLEFLVEKKVINKDDVSSLKLELTKTSLEGALLARGLSDLDVLSLRGEYYDIPIRKIEE